VDTVKARLVTSRRNNPTFAAADNDRLMGEGWIITFFNGAEKGIAIHMGNRELVKLWVRDLPVAPACPAGHAAYSALAAFPAQPIERAVIEMWPFWGHIYQSLACSVYVLS
jgi:hypothetical protein